MTRRNGRPPGSYTVRLWMVLVWARNAFTRHGYEALFPEDATE